MDFSLFAITMVWLPFLVAALTQSSFGLSISLLTLLSGHALSRKVSTARLVALVTHFLIGAAIAIGGLLVLAVYLFSLFASGGSPRIIWTILCAILAIIGFTITVFYYRRGGGTALWLPRAAARFLHDRVKKTRNNFESLLLGIGSILIEIIFIAPLIAVAGLLICGEPNFIQSAAIAIYVIIAILPMIFFAIMIAAGTKISVLQKWRERNKRFLQITAGVGMMALAALLFVYHAVEITP